jgi:hypothetical protein
MLSILGNPVIKKLTITSVLILAVFLSGCVARDNRFVGSWKGQIDSFTCFSDGSITASGWGGFISGGGHWDIKDGKFVIYSAENSPVASFQFSFSDDGNALTLVNTNNGFISVYTRQS